MIPCFLCAFACLHYAFMPPPKATKKKGLFGPLAYALPSPCLQTLRFDEKAHPFED